MREEIRPEILRYQREVVDVLYNWAQSPKAMTAPTELVPVEQITKPEVRTDNAGLDAWRDYYHRMVLWIDWQQDIETWRGSVESRLEGLEEVADLIPEILERLGPQKLTPYHQRAVQQYVQQVRQAPHGYSRGRVGRGDFCRHPQARLTRLSQGFLGTRQR